MTGPDIGSSTGEGMQQEAASSLIALAVRHKVSALRSMSLHFAQSYCAGGIVPRKRDAGVCAKTRDRTIWNGIEWNWNVHLWCGIPSLCDSDTI